MQLVKLRRWGPDQADAQRNQASSAVQCPQALPGPCMLSGHAMCCEERLSACRRMCVSVFLHVSGEEEGNGQAREAGSSQICFCSKKNLKKQNLGFSLSFKKIRRKTF